MTERALNRGLRWDSEALVDTVPRFALPLRSTRAPARPRRAKASLSTIDLRDPAGRRT